MLASESPPGAPDRAPRRGASTELPSRKLAGSDSTSVRAPSLNARLGGGSASLTIEAAESSIVQAGCAAAP
jgi:hypothetical protein